MRTLSIGLNSIIILFFSGFLAYTFFAEEHLSGLAREFVTEKTVDYSAPLVSLAEESMDLPLIKKVVSDKTEQQIRKEIARYRNDPEAYISDLTQQVPQPVLQKNPALEAFSETKQAIRKYYEETLTALLVDLRLFASCNLCAGMIALGIAFRFRSKQKKSLDWFSILLFGAVIHCSWLYVDHLNFFRIFFRVHMGWWYPILLGVVTTGLWLDYSGRLTSDVGQENEPEEEPSQTETV